MRTRVELRGGSLFVSSKDAVRRVVRFWDGVGDDHSLLKCRKRGPMAGTEVCDYVR